MCEALRRVRDIAAAWCMTRAHAESFPPIVFNITDGEATDCDNRTPRRGRADQVAARPTVTYCS